MTSYVAKKYLSKQAKQYEPTDPYYEIITTAKGKQKRVKRDVPPGLTKKEEKVLRKVRKRAHYLDKGMNLCGFRVGWTFWIGIIPGAGDVVNIVLNYSLVVKPSRTLDLPPSVVGEMMFNNTVAAGVGFVPLVGDVVMAVWKTNWRNAHILEAHLRKRGEENLRQGGQSALTEVTDATVAEASGTGAVGGVPGQAFPGQASTVPGAGPSLTTATAATTPAAAPAKPKRRWFGGGSNAATNAVTEAHMNEAEIGLNQPAVGNQPAVRRV